MKMRQASSPRREAIRARPVEIAPAGGRGADEGVLFATATPGLEEALRGEVQGLPGVQGARVVEGGVEFWGERGGAQALVGEANLRLRSAGRVLLRLGGFPATRLPQLRSAVAALPWERHLRDATVTPRVTCHKSCIYHSGAAAERLLEGIGDRLEQPRAPQPAPHEQEAAGGAPLVLLRGVHDQWEVSLDTSGDLLHLRGYRKDAVAAPLRESLAAGLLLAAGYSGGPLIDLCCGSGTFVIEAALINRRIPPGLQRDFAFTAAPQHDRARFQAQLVAARAEVAPAPAQPEILGVDRDAGAIAQSARNSDRAGIAADVRLRCADLFTLPSLSELLPGARPLIVANPPYGRRLGVRRDQHDLYQRLGRFLRARFPGCPVLVLCGSPDAAAALRLPLPVLRVRNGGLPILAVHGTLPAAPLR